MLARGRSICLLKRLEEAADLLLGQANASVADGEVDKLTFFVFLLDSRLNDDLAALREFDGIVAVVDQDLPETKRVSLRMGGDPGQCRR